MNIRRFVASVGILCLLTGLVPQVAAAYDPLSGVCPAGGQSSTSAVCTDKSTNGNPISGSNGVLEKVTNIIALVSGAAAIILILVGSIRYVISNGDSNKINSAKNTVINSLIGLAIVVIARTIIIFVLGKLK